MVGSDDADPFARLLEVGGGSVALGTRVTVELARPFTVMVGRNGAGKSSLLRLIRDFALQATTGIPVLTNPIHARRFECRAEFGGVEYRYTAGFPPWEEACVRGTDVLWTTAGGVTTGNARPLVMPPTAGVLSIDIAQVPAGIRSIAGGLKTLFGSVGLVPSGVPSPQGTTIFVTLRPGGMLEVTPTDSRIVGFVQQLVRWQLDGDERFDRVGDVLRRIGACSSLRFTAMAHLGDSDIGQIEVDGLNLGAASDGTLRAIEVVVALQAAPGSLVMIEEPESGVHPGLCDRLLEEFEAAADDLQLIITTHNPRVVDQVDYRQLRHVRRNGATTVDALTAEQVDEVKTFLSARGTLGEYVFSDDFGEASE